MSAFAYLQRFTREDHLHARTALENAVAKEPRNSDCWAMLAWIRAHEHGHGLNAQPHSIDRSLAAARKAVDLNPANHLAYQALATALFLGNDPAWWVAAERAIALNPIDGGSNAAMGSMMLPQGDVDRGAALIERAMELNPFHPVWYRIVLALKYYVKGDDRATLDALSKTNGAGVYWTHLYMAASHARLGDREAAAQDLCRLTVNTVHLTILIFLTKSKRCVRMRLRGRRG